MKNINPRLIVALILIISLSSYGIYRYYSTPDSDTIEASGTIKATQVNVLAKLNGTLESINVSEGAEVEKGHILAVLSRPDLTVRRERDLLKERANIVFAVKIHLENENNRPNLVCLLM